MFNQYTGPKDISGKQFGRLTTSKLVRKNNRVYWECKCSCGSSVVVRQDALKNGRTKSCGCLNTETRKLNGEKNKKHGMNGHQFHTSWRAMKARCNNKNHVAFKYYGGRGIKVCKRWEDFENFKADMFGSWKSGLTIERKNVNGNYEPKNCTWIPQSEQHKNKR